MQIATDVRPDTACKRLKTEVRPSFVITSWRSPSGQAFTTVHHVSAGLIHISGYGDTDQ